MAFRKWQIKYFIIILLATSTFTVYIVHSVCHLRFFYYWVDDNDQNKNDFLKLGTDLRAFTSALG